MLLYKFYSILFSLDAHFFFLWFSAFKCWCQAVWQCSLDIPLHPSLDSDIMWDQVFILLHVTVFQSQLFHFKYAIFIFGIFLSWMNNYHILQVISKFCFWAFIESLGSFAGSKGSKNVLCLFLIVTSFCFAQTFICSFTLVLIN